MEEFGPRDFFLSFICMTIAIEAFYITIFLFRYKTTGNRRSRKVRNNLMLRNRDRWNEDDTDLEYGRRQTSSSSPHHSTQQQQAHYQTRPQNPLSNTRNSPPYQSLQDSRRKTTGGLTVATTVPFPNSQRRPTYPPTAREAAASQDHTDTSHYNWDRHTLEEGDIKVVPLNPRSDEYCDVAEVFHETLPNSNIIRIERIQNEILRQKYDDCLRRLKHQYSTSTIEERLLFHGTKENSPSCIYEGDSSFDMRYSQQGMWGKGNYFAVKASYSDKFAHEIGDARQLLVAMVITGTSYPSKPQANLRQPPPRPHKQRGLQVHYDSVVGETQGSRVYITYENDRAYPMYLITYKK